MRVKLHTTKRNNRNILIGDLVYNPSTYCYYIVVDILSDEYKIVDLVTGKISYINNHRDLIELAQGKITIYNN